MSTAVIVGIGNGVLSRQLAGQSKRVITIGLPGENPSDLPGNTFMVSQPSHASEIIEKAFGKHADVVSLAETTFHDQHAIAESNVMLRKRFCAEFYSLLSRRPLEFGDDVLDGLQGAYHVAHNAKYLLPAPTIHELPKLTCPAIAIAAGPSLNRHVDNLRKLQDKCLLVSCDSSFAGLIKRGVTPHIVTPHERLKDVKSSFFPLSSYPGIFCGNPAVHHDILPSFARHIYMPGVDLLYKWAEAPESSQTSFGQSTGTLAVSVAMNLTTGPVYLVGHDLAFAGDKSHWDDAGALALTGVYDETFTVPGYAGPIRTQYWWDVFRREIETFAQKHGNVVNVNAPDGVGAIINGTLSGSLPDAATLADFVLPIFPERNEQRYDLFRDKVHALPGEARSLLSKLSTRSRMKPEELDLRKLCPGPNRILFSYILRSILGQFSMELRMRKQDVVIDGMMQALRNSVSGCMGIFEEMAICV